MGPIGLHLYAQHYLSAAKSLPEPTVPFEPVRPYLVCHAIELALKAFLSLEGKLMVELADGKLAHKLGALLSAAEEASLSKIVSLSDAQENAVRLAETYYAGKVFEYPAVGEAISAYPGMPSLSLLFEVATLLVEQLAIPCYETN